MKVKKPTTGQLKKKTDELASKYYRAMTPHCELAGADSITCNGVLQWAHIFTRSILHMRYEPYNHLILCAGHHLFYTYHPIEWVRVLERNYPDRLAIAEANRYKYGKPDYQEWIQKFKDGL